MAVKLGLETAARPAGLVRIAADDLTHHAARLEGMTEALDQKLRNLLPRASWPETRPELDEGELAAAKLEPINASTDLDALRDTISRVERAMNAMADRIDLLQQI